MKRILILFKERPLKALAILLVFALAGLSIVELKDVVFHFLKDYPRFVRVLVYIFRDFFRVINFLFFFYAFPLGQYSFFRERTEIFR